MADAKKKPVSGGEKPPVRRRDRERTRREILEIAFAEFAENGLSGGNTDAIAARANITKRLIFYYFNSKEELFTAVLEMAYAKMRLAEKDLHLEALEPEAAIRRLAEFTFDFDQANPEYVRLVTIENIHRGRHISVSRKLKEMTRPTSARSPRCWNEACAAARSGRHRSDRAAHDAERALLLLGREPPHVRGAIRLGHVVAQGEGAAPRESPTCCGACAGGSNGGGVKTSRGRSGQGPPARLQSSRPIKRSAANRPPPRNDMCRATRPIGDRIIHPRSIQAHLG